ncbi:MAG: bifunctional pyr operon transcriptional regulator/uracil phosphoribosyltransferase PyrR, partial [Phycisphaerae bacterium]
PLAMQALMNAAQIEQTVAELARRLATDTSILPLDPDRTALVGIRSRGEILAARLAAVLAQTTGVTLPVGALDITMYRDDLAQRRAMVIPQGTDMNFRLDGRVVVLVDDVLETGRSVRAALDALVDFGRPRLIRLLALADRGGREYPIAADYVGVKLDADPRHKVVVHLRPMDVVDEVFLKSK